jgi:hypothetical protein
LAARKGSGENVRTRERERGIVVVHNKGEGGRLKAHLVVFISHIKHLPQLLVAMAMTVVGGDGGVIDDRKQQ